MGRPSSSAVAAAAGRTRIDVAGGTSNDKVSKDVFTAAAVATAATAAPSASSPTSSATSIWAKLSKPQPKKCVCKERCACIVRDAALKRLVRKGIPPEERAEAWYRLSGADVKQAAAPPGAYAALLAESDSHLPASTAALIQHDVDALYYTRATAAYFRAAAVATAPSAGGASTTPGTSAGGAVPTAIPGAPTAPFMRGSHSSGSISSIPGATAAATAAATTPSSASSAGSGQRLSGSLLASVNGYSTSASTTSGGGASLSRGSGGSSAGSAGGSAHANADALAAVLAAYAHRNPAAAHSNGLVRVGALLVSVLGPNEERVFWVLAALLEDRLFPHTSGELLCGARVELGVLQQLLPTKCPRVAAYLESCRVDVSLLAAPWFNSLFTSSLAPEATMRVWDCLMCEGPKVLIRVALALIKKYESAITACKESEMMARLLPARVLHGSADANELINYAFNGIGSLRGAVLCSARRSGCVEARRCTDSYRRLLLQ